MFDCALIQGTHAYVDASGTKHPALFYLRHLSSGSQLMALIHTEKELHRAIKQLRKGNSPSWSPEEPKTPPRVKLWIDDP